MTPDPATSRAPWRPGPLAVLVALTTVTMVVVLLGVLVNLGNITKSFPEARITANQSANAQYDVGAFHRAMLNLRMAQMGLAAGTATPQDVDAAALEALVRRDSAMNNLGVVLNRIQGARVLQRGITPPLLRRVIREFRDIRIVGRARRDPAYTERSIARVAALELEYKNALDDSAGEFRDVTQEALVKRQNAQWLLGALILLTLLLGAAWIARSRLRSRGEVKDARRAVRTSEERFRSLVQNSSDLTLLVGADGTIAYVSPAASVLVGRDPESLLGTTVADLAYGDDRPVLAGVLRRVGAQEATRQRAEFRVVHADGSLRSMDATISDLRADPAVQGLVFNIRDVTDRHTLEAQLAHQAFHDALTGLPNRALLGERIEHAHARAVRHACSVALILIDLDDFKAVNDGLGHMAGDRLLTAVARRLADTVRPGDTVARLGGDEFVVFAEDIEDREAAGALAERLLTALREQLHVDPTMPPVFASAGIRYADAADIDPQNLLRDADLAMYAAKSRGKGCWALFEPGMHDTASAQLALRADLHHAVERNELELRFEPWVALDSGRVLAFEALVRWRHPTRGLLSPGSFIGVAEETGLIDRLGAWVLEEGARAMTRLQESAGRPDLTLSVNLSPRQLNDDGLVDIVRAALEESGLPAQQLVLEVTEGAFLAQTAAVTSCLDRLRALGVRLALDDFGTGFSSLGYLERLPLDILKVDRSFVAPLAETASRTAVVATVVRLGDALGLTTIAEGVETPEQLAALRTLGCGVAQGYLFARPLMEADAVALLRDGVAGVPRPVVSGRG